MCISNELTRTWGLIPRRSLWCSPNKLTNASVLFFLILFCLFYSFGALYSGMFSWHTILAHTSRYNPTTDGARKPLCIFLNLPCRRNDDQQGRRRTREISDLIYCAVAGNKQTRFSSGTYSNLVCLSIPAAALLVLIALSTGHL